MITLVRMQLVFRGFALAVVAAGVLVACAPGDQVERSDSEVARSTPQSMHGAPPDEELAQAAEVVIRFLRGELPFGELRTADTVALRLSPEGGGWQSRLPRESLSDPGNWVVRTSSGDRYSLVPPRSLRLLTVQPGVHFNCREYPLATRAPDLAELPHVGVRLMSSSAESCLQSWNLTLVFDAPDGVPVLVAAIYDQWEW